MKNIHIFCVLIQCSVFLSKNLYFWPRESVFWQYENGRSENDLA